MNRLLPSSKARRASGVPRSSGTARPARPPLASRFASVALAALLAAGLVPATALAAPASGAASRAASRTATAAAIIRSVEFGEEPAPRSPAQMPYRKRVLLESGMSSETIGKITGTVN